MSECVTIKPDEIFWKEGGYRHTTPVKTEIMNTLTNEITIIEDRQWSRILRKVVNYLQPYIDKCVDEGYFMDTFNTNLDNLLNFLEIKENVNFSRKIFTDDSFMNSSLYKNNANHKLKLYEHRRTKQDMCICAVYIDEIIWVMKSLIQTISDILGEKFIIDVEYNDKKQRIDTLPEDDIRVQLNKIIGQLTEVTSQLLILSNKL